MQQAAKRVGATERGVHYCHVLFMSIEHHEHACRGDGIYLVPGTHYTCVVLQCVMLKVLSSVALVPCAHYTPTAASFTMCIS